MRQAPQLGFGQHPVPRGHRRAAHAGVEPEKGIPAITIAAEVVLGLPQGRQDHETTGNVGKINGTAVTAERKTFKQLSVDYLKDYDVILGADVCFWDEMTGELYNLMSRARKAGARLAMISDPCRPPFTDLAEKCEAKMDDVERVEKFLKRPVNASGEILIVRN